MLDFNKDLTKLTTQFEHVRKEVKKSPLLSQKNNSKIESLSEKITRTKKKLESNIIKSTNKGVDLTSIEKAYTNLNKFKELHQEIINLKAELPAAFQAKETRNILKKIFHSSLGAISRALTRPIRLKIFAGGSSKVKKQMQKKNLDKLENRLLKLSKKEVKLNNALVQMELVIANQGNISKSNLDNLKNKTKKIESKINTIHTNYNKINLIRSELLKKTDKSEKNFRTGETMRNACKTLGGERVTLTTSDSVKLDSIYLDASRFRNKLADAGCELLTIKQNESGSGLNALFITKENYNQSGKEVFKALEELRAFANPDLTKSDPGAGWQIVHHPYGILIINESELSSIKKHPFIQYNESEGYLEFKQEANKNIEYTRTSIDRELPAAGTAIITSGNAGVYEMHKNEAAFFLLRNMNVMMFNFRGYGESEGTPNQSGMQLDIECAYQFVKARFKDEDKKILFKSLCMSGAFASYMAAKHPQTNIILDQSYSKFNRVIKHQLNTESAYEKIPSFLRKTVAQIMSYLTLDINISKRLQKNEGKIGIIYSHEDELMEMEHVERNMEAISKAGKLANVTLMSIPGDHASPVIRSKASQDAFGKNRGKKLEKKFISLLKAYNKTYNQLIELENKAKGAASQVEKSAIKKTTEKLTEINLKLNSIENSMKKINELNEAVGQTQIDRFLKKANLGHSLLEN